MNIASKIRRPHSSVISSVISLAAITATCGLISTLGCGSEGEGGSVRVINASPTSSSVDVKANNGLIAGDLPYGQATGYAEVNEGVTFEIFSSEDDSPLARTKFTLAKSEAYTVVAGNFPGALQLVNFSDTRTPASQGQANVRALHAAPSAPPVDVYVTAGNGTADSSLVEVTPALSGISLFTASRYLTIPSGLVQIRVTPSGSKSVVIDTGVVNLSSTGAYTLIALDSKNGGAPFSLTLLEDTLYIND